MKRIILADHVDLSVTIVLTVGIIGVLFASIVASCGGQFIYTLDDPYIHLAFAKQLAAGNMGLTANSLSVPSSSILWPIFLVPFTFLSVFEYVPLIANICLTIYLACYLLEFLTKQGIEHIWYRVGAVFVILAVTNAFGLVFNGLEHTLHLVVTALIVGGLFDVVRGFSPSRLFWIALVISPAVRYEGLFLLTIACLFLFFRGYRVGALVSFVLVVCLLLGFSGLLYSRGVGVLPSSIVAKSKSATALDKVFTVNAEDYVVSVDESQFIRPVREPSTRTGLTSILKPAVFLFGLSLFAIVVFRSFKDGKGVGMTILGSGLCHFAFASLGGLHRYEMYIYLALLMSAFALVKLSSMKLNIWLACVAILIVGAKGVLTTVTSWNASLNIFQQQAQMMVFVRDFWKKPVALNDIGIVAFRSGQDVLDLAGLASLKSLRSKRVDPSGMWVENAAIQEQIECVMIYETWFKAIPRSWTKVGELKLGSKVVSAAGETVSIYATSDQAADALRPLLMDFTRSVPPGVKVLIVP